MLGYVKILGKRYRFDINPLSNGNKIAKEALQKFNKTMFCNVSFNPKILQLNDKEIAEIFSGKDKQAWEEFDGEKLMKLEGNVNGFFHFWYPDLIFIRKSCGKIESTVTHEVFHLLSNHLGWNREDLLCLDKSLYLPYRDYTQHADYAKPVVNYWGNYWFRYIILRALEEA